MNAPRTIAGEYLSLWNLCAFQSASGNYGNRSPMDASTYDRALVPWKVMEIMVTSAPVTE